MTVIGSHQDRAELRRSLADLHMQAATVSLGKGRSLMLAGIPLKAKTHFEAASIHRYEAIRNYTKAAGHFIICMGQNIMMQFKFT